MVIILKFLDILKKIRKKEVEKPKDVEDELLVFLNGTDIPDHQKDIITGIIMYFFEDIGIIDDLFNFLLEKITKNALDVGTIDEDSQYSLEYLNFYSGKLNAYENTIKWIIKQIGAEEVDVNESDVILPRNPEE